MKKLIIFAAILFVAATLKAQELPAINIKGYLEAYYGFDFNKPADNNRPVFIYSHNRHNEVNLNLGYIKAGYDAKNVRANLAIMAGTYANANLAAEPGVLKNIYEANAGIRLGEGGNIWLDAGIFSSHIGFESAVSKDCWTLTRGISSENTPYYEAGAKITYGSRNGKLTATVLYLNGWQKIKRPDGNSKPAGGLQLSYQPSPKLTLNYSNYLGTEGIDPLSVNRLYHNFYAVSQITERFGLTAGFDYGTQKITKGATKKSEMFAAVLIGRYRFYPKWAMAARVENYTDKDGIFISTGTPNGFNTMGYSLNLDYSVASNALVRVEGKMFKSRDKIFENNNGFLDHNEAVTASLAVSF